MIEEEIEGKQFRFEKLNAMQQFHLSRKIAPLLPPLMPAFTKFLADKEKGVKLEEDLDVLGTMLQPFADGLAGMSDEASEYIFNTCLSSIKYLHGQVWIKLWNAEVHRALVDELNDFSLLLRLVLRVIRQSLGPFLDGFLTKENGAEDPTQLSDNSPAEKTGS